MTRCNRRRLQDLNIIQAKLMSSIHDAQLSIAALTFAMHDFFVAGSKSDPTL